MRNFKQAYQLKIKGTLRVLLSCLLLAFCVAGAARQAMACYLCDVEYNMMQVQVLNAYIMAQHELTREMINEHTDLTFDQHEDQFMMHTFFEDYWGRAMRMMAEQLTAVAMQQMGIVGTFFDAKHQLETERLFGELAAQAHKDYHPSEGLCSIGSTSRLLAGAERRSDLASWVLSRRALERQTLGENSLGSEGHKTDKIGRTEQFIRTYCDFNDNAGNLNGICDANVPRARKNKDIDYVRTIESPMTLDINFASATGPNNNEATADETDLLALQTNLFGTEIFKQPIPPAHFYQTARDPRGNLQRYLDTRAITAMRSVAQNSFNEIAALKASGSTGGNMAQYVQAAIRQLNPDMSVDDARLIAGDNPSYDAQMDILTQKMLQSPQFFTDLYDKPANVARKGVAIQAISNIQERDNYKVTLRSEMLWSQLLELQLIKAQSNLQSGADGMGK